jgi:hypothetical protein
MYLKGQSLTSKDASPLTHSYKSRVSLPGAFLEVFHETITPDYPRIISSSNFPPFNFPFLPSPSTTHYTKSFTCFFALSSSSPFPSISR